MPKFRRKPVVIEAELYNDEFLTRYHGTAHYTGFLFNGDELIIKTLEGDMRANPGDWIITGVKGEKYPCKPDIFAAIYEPVEDTCPADLVSQ